MIPAPPADVGFFGPESVTWKVFRHPSSFTVGFQRTVVAEMFEPFLLASVADTQAVMARPAIRYDRTLQYVATVAFGDRAAVLKAADVLVRIHAHIRGREPLSGLPYDANDPEAQLWIHLTQWHSVLLAYEVFGPGPLTTSEDRQYWAECRRAAAFQTIDPDTVPDSREAMRAYYDRMRPHLVATEATQEFVAHLLNPVDGPLGDVPVLVRPAVAVARAVMRKATIATLPRWLRSLGGISQTRAEDVVAVALTRAAMRLLEQSPSAQLTLLRMLSPRTAEVAGPAILGIPAITQAPMTPEEAYADAELPTPRQRYGQQLASRSVDVPSRAPVDRGPASLSSFR